VSTVSFTAMTASVPSPTLTAADITLAALYASRAMADDIELRLVDDGFDDLRFSDGALLQHLVAEPIGIGPLADLLGITQQATSKAIADLELRGYVFREEDPRDARVRLVRLSARGRDLLAADRLHRERLEQELCDTVGPRRVTAARRALIDIVSTLGAESPSRGRRFRPPV